MTDIAKRLRAWAVSVGLGYDVSDTIAEKTMREAADEIERLREENERYRTALLGICRPVWSTPPIDSEAANVYASICQEMINIAQFALAATTAHTPVNTAANKTDASQGHGTMGE